MKLTIIDTSRADSWDQAVAEVSGDDVYYSSAYHRLCELNGEGRGFLAVGTTDDGVCAVNSFMLRPITGDAKHRYDISTVYGYGGPLISPRSLESERVEREFTAQFMNYCRNNAIVAGFTRFHPLLGNHRAFESWNPVYVRRTVYMDLQQQPVWDGIGSKNRNMIRKAQRNGVEVVEDNSPEAYRQFTELYCHTMDRNNAADFYYFPQPYFTALAGLLKDRVSLFLARHEGQTIVGAIIMRGGGMYHYHLAASCAESLKLAPNNLILFEVAQRGQSEGGRYFHLGGGYRGEDSLFHFKASFSPDTAEFYVAKTVYKDDDYRELSDEAEPPWTTRDTSLQNEESNSIGLPRVAKKNRLATGQTGPKKKLSRIARTLIREPACPHALSRAARRPCPPGFR